MHGIDNMKFEPSQDSETAGGNFGRKYL